MTKPRCKWCKSRKLVKNGKRPGGKRQQWLCKACGRSTYFDVEEEGNGSVNE